MFDLIDECGKDLKMFGYSEKKCSRYGISVASLKINSNIKSQQLGLQKGDYYIINSPFLYSLGKNNEEYLSKLIALKLEELLKKQGIKKRDNVLIACLGNFDIEGDRLGKEVFDRVEISTLKQKNNIFKFCPNIFLYTGIETAQLIKLLVKQLSIKCVIIIDSLLSANINRLGISFQLSSGGMTPGSGMNRFGKAIEEKDIGAKCITIGVPFMINSKALNEDEREVILVPKDISQNISCAGKVIADAINKVLL